jgi:hypothetical protein
MVDAMSSRATESAGLFQGITSAENHRPFLPLRGQKV